jgi:hypothetical protein
MIPRIQLLDTKDDVRSKAECMSHHPLDAFFAKRGNINNSGMYPQIPAIQLFKFPKSQTTASPQTKWGYNHVTYNETYRIRLLHQPQENCQTTESRFTMQNLKMMCYIRD